MCLKGRRCKSEQEVSRGRSSWATSQGPNEKESWKVMKLGSASHQKSGQPERVVTSVGESHVDVARDEARPAFQLQEGLGRKDLLGQALSRENIAAAWKRVKTNKGSAGVDGLTIEETPEYLKTHWSRIRLELLLISQ